MAELTRHGIPDTLSARRFLLAIALQESALAHRRQVVAGGAEAGPASSFWQFEQGGGCKGVLTHYRAAPIMKAACVDFNVQPTPAGLWEAMRYHDIVAAIVARLLIYTLPSKLPATPEAGWAQYISGWRPGKPHPHTWADNWALATSIVGEE
jgi:hypothetical protein